MSIFSESIKQGNKRLKISVADAAGIIGISRSTLFEFIAGTKNNPTSKTLTGMSRLYGWSDAKAGKIMKECGNAQD